jgi:hypothetical protein
LCSFSFLPPLLCANFQFVVYSGFFSGGSVYPGGYAGLFQEWLRDYCMMLGSHLFGLLNVSKAILVPTSGSTAALLFSQCNMA